MSGGGTTAAACPGARGKPAAGAAARAKRSGPTDAAAPGGEESNPIGYFVAGRAR